jgi:hypothetical protein
VNPAWNCILMGISSSFLPVNLLLEWGNIFRSSWINLILSDGICLIIRRLYTQRGGTTSTQLANIFQCMRYVLIKLERLKMEEVEIGCWVRRSVTVSCDGTPNTLRLPLSSPYFNSLQKYNSAFLRSPAPSNVSRPRTGSMH